MAEVPTERADDRIQHEAREAAEGEREDHVGDKAHVERLRERELGGHDAHQEPAHDGAEHDLLEREAARVAGLQRHDVVHARPPGRAQRVRRAGESAGDDLRGAHAVRAGDEHGGVRALEHQRAVRPPVLHAHRRVERRGDAADPQLAGLRAVEHRLHAGGRDAGGQDRRVVRGRIAQRHHVGGHEQRADHEAGHDGDDGPRHRTRLPVRLRPIPGYGHAQPSRRL